MAGLCRKGIYEPHAENEYCFLKGWKSNYIHGYEKQGRAHTVGEGARAPPPPPPPSKVLNVQCLVIVVMAAAAVALMAVRKVAV